MTTWTERGAEGWGSPGIIDVTEDYYGTPTQEVVLCFQEPGTPPDWAKMPPELGGGQLRVLKQGKITALCGFCGEARGPVEQRALELEQGYLVGHCPVCLRYNWMKRREEKP